MKKALRILAVTAGIISIVSTVVLTFIYVEDMASNISKIKKKVTEKFKKDYAPEIEDDEF